ncbi:hypothetical protein GGR51DRAFT_505269 [Nemania sp. FL0031]|nr:hypothetical protein GGR51DRAFT_505269 [Nemania sp. FL0031]
MISSSTMGQNGAGQQKHRACDECRVRKLACTKEPDGCSRCRREGIPCHYSAQKPMGRPRKRAREESDENPAAAAAPPTKTVMTEQPPDTEDPGMQFINLLLGTEFDFHNVDPFAESQIPATTTPMETPASIHNPPWDYTSFGDVNFDSNPADHTPSFSTNIDPSLFITPASPSPLAADDVPALSPPTSNTTTPTQSSDTSPAAVIPSSASCCECTAKLYSALGWMQKVPTEVESAIRQARLATKVAYEVVNCPHCSFKIETPKKHYVGSPAMMRGFQNMMLLATLIPSIVHAYAGMLSVVDEETNRAIAERRKVVFKLAGLGGIWGGLGGADEKLCGTTESFDYREMEPTMWRLTVRALLKIDVYGISGRCGREVAPADPFHLGLKDIVLLMENKAKARHAFMDALVDAGAWESPCGLMQHPPGEPPTCQRIISIARSSVEQLCIA